MIFHLRSINCVLLHMCLIQLLVSMQIRHSSQSEAAGLAAMRPGHNTAELVMSWQSPGLLARH